MGKINNCNIEEEIWKDIEGYEGLYQVSNWGRVKSLDRFITHKNGKKFFLRGKILKTRPDKDGYRLVSLYLNGKKKDSKVHRLVATAFIVNDDPIKKTQVNHLDESKDNNHVENLEWISQEDNLNYGTGRERGGIQRRGQKISEEEREKLRTTHKHCRVPDYGIEKAREKIKKPVKCLETGAIFDSCKEAANYIGVHQSSLCDVLKGRSNTCRGMHWEYVKKENGIE